VNHGSQEPVYSVTGVRRGTSDDLAQRQRRYLISMSIRTLCFVLAVVTHGPIRWIFVAAAVVLPYIAVVMANAVGSSTVEAPTPYVPRQAALSSAQRSAIPYEPPDPAAHPPAGPSAGQPAGQPADEHSERPEDGRRAAS
jgi:hypothetical protein